MKGKDRGKVEQGVAEEAHMTTPPVKLRILMMTSVRAMVKVNKGRKDIIPARDERLDPREASIHGMFVLLLLKWLKCRS